MHEAGDCEVLSCLLNIKTFVKQNGKIQNFKKITNLRLASPDVLPLIPITILDMQTGAAGIFRTKHLERSTLEKVALAKTSDMNRQL